MEYVIGAVLTLVALIATLGFVVLASYWKAGR